MGVTSRWVEGLVRSRVRGLDALAVVPLEGLGAAAARALSALEEGLVPSSYRWTWEKTERAYRLERYGSWAKCVILAAKYYFTGEERPRDPAFGSIARFTWRNNYRYIVLKLREAVGALEAALGRPVRSKALSNYTSVPEKVLFRGGGLARLGKHGVLIRPEMGCLFTIGEAFCDLRVDAESEAPGETLTPTPDAPPGAEAAAQRTGTPEAYVPPAVPRLSPPRFSLCGGCDRCRRACPTGAIVSDGVVDVNRCIQYMTETLVLVPLEYRDTWGSRVYGCSDCLDACPHNERLEPWGERHGVGFVGTGFDLLSLLELGAEEWRSRFAGNQIGIRDRRAILKNAILSLGWLEYRKAAAPLARFLSHDHPVMRASAAWALGRIATAEAKSALERLARTERDAVVLEEIERFR